VNVNPGSIAGLTIGTGYTGTINLNGFTLTTTGANTFQAGTVTGASSTLTLNTTGLTTFSGTTFSVPITGTSGRILFNGSTFNNPIALTKTAATNDDGTGNNTFGSTFSLTNSSTARVRMASTNRDIFNGTVTLTVNNTGTFELAYGSAIATQFNDNITINYVNNPLVSFGSNNGLATVAPTKTMTVVPGAAGAGSLLLGGIAFASAQTIALTGNTTATMTIRTGASFSGTTSLTAPSFSFSASTFNGPLTMEKTGPAGNNIPGGNTYNSTANFINSGDGEFNIAYTTADTFNGDVQLNNSGAGRIQLGVDSPGNVINGTLTVNHGGNTAGINCILARNTPSSLTINGNVFLNENNANTGSGIIVGNDGDVVINGNVTMTCAQGRGILFANASTDASVTIGNGFSLSTTSATFTTGGLDLSRITQLGTANQTLSLGGTAVLNIGSGNTFNGPVDFRAPQVTLDASTFNNSTLIEKNGAGDNNGNGGAVFAGPTTIRMTSSGAFYNNGNNTYSGTTTFENSGSNALSFENTTGSIYNGPVTYNNTGSSIIRVARTGDTFFLDNIVVNSTAVGGQILFCETALATSATLASGKTISTMGFTAGELRLQRFTQLGTTAQTLVFAFPGTGLLRLGPSSTFNGNVTFSSPRILLNGATYNGTASFTKTGPTNDDGAGGNVFMGATTITNSGSAHFLTGNTSPDIFNALLTINNSGSSQVRLADGAVGTAFNDNIVLNASSGSGIYFGNGGGTSTLADDRTITAGSVINGDIRLIRITQASSVNPQVLNLDGIAILTVGPSSQFGGNVDFRAPQLLLNGCIYGTTSGNTIRLEKEGATDNIGGGGNVFNGTTTIINSGSAPLRTANLNADIFNGDVTVNNTGSSNIMLSYTATGSQYNGNLTFSNVLGGGGIFFGQNGGTSTLTPTGVLAIGPSGFISGDLRFARFTQTGALPQSLVLTPPAAGVARLRFGPASSFGGPVDFRAPRILLEGVTFDGTTYIEKTGATDDASAGGNVFNGVTTLAASGSGWFINANSALDQFNNDLTLTNTGSGGIRMADNIPGTEFHGNIVVNSTFGGGIYFADNNTAATAQLDAGKTITIGASGFTTGELRLRRFTQLGTTPQALTMTGTSGLRLGPNSTFNGDVTFRAPQLFINTGSFYNGTTYLEKTGATDNLGSGGSTFNSTTTIRNVGTGYLRTSGGNVFNGFTTLISSNTAEVRLEETSGSTYNADLDLINSGGSSIRAGAAGTTAFNGNVRVASVSGVGVFIGDNATTVTLADTKTISISPFGFSAGELRFSHFTQVGTGTPQTLTLTGTTTVLRFQLSTIFNSNLTTSSPRVFFDGATFNGVNSFTKTGVTNDDVVGGNNFNNTTNFVIAGTGRLRLANTTPDNYNGNMVFTRNTASVGALDVGYSGNNTFTGNILVNSPNIITIGGGASGIATMTGTNTQVISKSGAASLTVNRMVIDKASNGITLDTDVNVGVSATFTNGIITPSASANFLNFANGATTTGASNTSHVSGPVRKTGTDAFTFPVGKGGIYKSIAVGTRGAAGDQFTAEYFNTVQTSGSTMGPGLDRVSGCEYWNLVRNTGASTPTVTLSWRNSDCPNPYVQNTTDLRVASYNTTLSRWESRGNGGVTGVGAGLPDEGTIVSSAGLSIFGAFALGTSTSSNALPIELVDFSATNMGAYVMLNWNTESEHDNDFFTIQRSTDGAEFSELGQVNGAGESRKKISYTYNDESPLNGIAYYRLKQTDFNGKSSYSKMVKINRDEEPMLMVYPNPMVGQTARLNMKGTFTIYNSLGQAVVFKENANELDISTLTAGVYVIRSASGQSCRLVID
jgi:hypothetical protein